MNQTPEPVDPFSPEELERIVAEATANAGGMPTTEPEDGDDDVMHLIGEVEWQEHTDMPPLSIRMIVQWPQRDVPDMNPEIHNMVRRTHIARMAAELAEFISEELQNQIPVDMGDDA